MNDTAQKVILQVPRRLLDRADRRAHELNTNRSNLFRTAVAEWLERSEQEQLEERLRIGCIENAEVRLAEHARFESLHTELLSLA